MTPLPNVNATAVPTMSARPDVQVQATDDGEADGVLMPVYRRLLEIGQAHRARRAAHNLVRLEQAEAEAARAGRRASEVRS